MAQVTVGNGHNGLEQVQTCDLFLLRLQEACASAGYMLDDWQTDTHHHISFNLKEKKKKRIKGFKKQSYFSASCDELLSRHKRGMMHKVTKFKHLFFGKSSLRNIHSFTYLTRKILLCALPKYSASLQKILLTALAQLHCICQHYKSVYSPSTVT